MLLVPRCSMSTLALVLLGAWGRMDGHTTAAAQLGSWTELQTAPPVSGLAMGCELTARAWCNTSPLPMF